MKIEDLIVGNCLGNIKCENFLDPDTRRVRVRPLDGQGLPTNIFIECSMKIRHGHPLGTKFLAKDTIVCIKPNGRKYLRAEGQMIYKLP